jgi:hypothetical protein
MTITFEQFKSASRTSTAATWTIFLDNPVKDGSSLIVILGAIGNIRAIDISQNGDVVWNVIEDSTGNRADSENGCRVQIWAAHDVKDAGQGLTLRLSGSPATSKDTGVIISEWSGNTFKFPNPADRLTVKAGSTPPATPGTIDTTPATASIREDEELLIGAATADKPVTYSNPGLGYTLRAQTDVGSPAVGKLAALDRITFTPVGVRFTVDHTADAGGVSWEAAACAIRGALQVPAPETPAPTVSEPIAEVEDHTGVAIGHLLEEFKSHDKR